MLRTNIFRQAAPGGCADYGQKQAQATIFARLAWTLVVALTALIVASTGYSARAADVVDSSLNNEKNRDAVHSAAMSYDIRTNPYPRDYLFRVAVTTRELENGTAVDDIVRTVNDESREFWLARYGGYREGSDKAATAKMLSGYATFGAGVVIASTAGIAGAPLIASGARDMYLGGVDLFRDKKTAIPREIQRMATDKSRHKSVEIFVNGFRSAFSQSSTRQEIHDNWSLLFPTGNPDLGPLQSVDDLINASPPLKANREVLTAITRSETSHQETVDRSTKYIADLVAQVGIDTQEGIQMLADSFGAYADTQTDRWAGLQKFIQQEEIDRITRRRQQEKRIKIEGLRAAGYVVTTVVGFADEDAGKKLSAVVSTTFDVYDAVDTFLNVSAEFGGLTSFAAAAMTGDLLSAGIKLVSAFIDTGPTADELILDEIVKLRRQVEEVRVQMHERFDRVDERLNQIHVDLRRGMSVLEDLIRSNHREITQSLSTILRVLENHERTMQDTLHAILAQVERIIERQEAHALEACSQHKSIVEDISREEFVKCLSEFHAFAIANVFEADQMKDVFDADQMKEVDQMKIDDFPVSSGEPGDPVGSADDLVNWAFQGFKNLSDDDASLPGSVVGPAAWFSLADRTDRFMLDWPEHVHLVKSDTPYRRKMNQYREDLRTYVSALEDDYRKFRNGEKSAIGALFDELRAGASVLGEYSYVEDQVLSELWLGSGLITRK